MGAVPEPSAHGLDGHVRGQTPATPDLNPATAQAPRLRALEPRDWPAVEAIYAGGIRSGLATFEVETPSWEEWDASHLPAHRVVAELDGDLVGWGALAPISGRRVYRGVAEVSVYVSGPVQGRGIGQALLEALVSDSERGGIWTLQAGVFPENAPSLALHRRCGFRDVGIRERIGKRDGLWRDVVLLERRSPLDD